MNASQNGSDPTDLCMYLCVYGLSLYVCLYAYVCVCIFVLFCSIVYKQITLSHFILFLVKNAILYIFILFYTIKKLQAHHQGYVFGYFKINFLLGNKFRFTQKLQRKYRVFLYTPHLAFLNVHILHIVIHLPKLRNEHGYITIY